MSFHYGLPEAGHLHALRQAGVQVLSSATTVAEARWLAAQGVSAVIAQGYEAGGHRGTFASESRGGRASAPSRWCRRSPMRSPAR